MFRLLKTIFRKIAGIFGRHADGLEEDPDVIAATYDASIQKSGESYQQTKNAVAKLMGIEESKKAELNATTAEINRLNNVQAGAIAKAKNRVAQLQASGKSAEEIKQDAELIKHQTAYTQTQAALQKATDRSRDQTVILERMQANLSRMKTSLETMQRNQNNLRQEKQEAIADVSSAKEMEKVNELLSGISTDSTDKDLQAAREARKNVSNRARLASELAGIDASISDAEYEKAAMASTAGSEFDNLIGLDKVPAPTLDPARLPES